MQEAGGAVERIDHPDMGLVGALAEAAFLAEEAVTWPRFEELGAEDFFGAMIGRGDEVRRALHRDLQVRDFAEVALEAAARLARSRLHHVEQGGLSGQDELRAPKVGATSVTDFLLGR